jgi:uncharacterized membrane protein
MDPILIDWLELFVRWAHVMLGIGWIGTSFFFVWLDMSLRANPNAPRGVGGDSWMVHGGGFYQARKYLVAPESLPKELHWFKYEAYFTWVSGFLLLGLVYYLEAGTFLIDPRVMALTPAQAILLSIGALAVGWLLYDGLCKSPLGRRTGWLALMVFVLAIGFALIFVNMFSGRAAFLHIGALLGTIMSANVFFVIIPNQKKAVAALTAGQTPDPILGLEAKQRSLHNNYLTLPVVLTMVSNHYPMLFEQPYAWLSFAALFVIAALVRHFYNLKDAGRRGNWIDWLLVYALGIAIVLVIVSVDLSRRNEAIATAGPPMATADILPIIENRCLACHSATPSDAGFRAPPKGIAFDSAAEVERYADQILRVTVRTQSMPLGNRTGMTAEERGALARWRIGADEAH